MTEYTRLTDVITSYWESLSHQNNIPKEADINWNNMEKISEDCFLVEVCANGAYKYEYLGANIIAAYGSDDNRDEVEMLVYPSRDRVAEKFGDVVSSKAPINDAGEFINYQHMLIKYRQVLFPLRGTTGKIDYILGGMRWKSF